MAYELIDHTGDIGVVARASTLEALFAECARAMFAILADAPAPAPSASDSFPVAGADPAEELRDFLGELLYRFSTEHRMYVAFAAKPGAVDAAWEPYDTTRHPLRTELKAVTYHQLEALREGEGWRGRVIFDV
ncbi:MAG: archease [Planctomycetes bacterium]|nr:archease [Planctomycetota bacterium]